MTERLDLQGKRIVLGLSGGIACYKAAELTRALVTAGASVQVVMTDAAETSSAEQAESDSDRGDQLSDDQTMRNWAPSSWPSSEPQAPSSGS